MNETLVKLNTRLNGSSLVVGGALIVVGVGIGYILGRTPGPQGPQGPMGPRGREGEAGSQGPAGEDGTVIGPAPEEKTELIEIVRENAYTFGDSSETKISTSEPEDPPQRNIFAPEVLEWKFEQELSNRTADEPYVIRRDEYENDEMGYDQITLTYYVLDDILTDDKDVPIHRHELIVGALKFGHGSGDKTIVYVRNESLNAEYEILRHEGSYQNEILGLEIENEYSRGDSRERPPKFRME